MPREENFLPFFIRSLGGIRNLGPGSGRGYGEGRCGDVGGRTFFCEAVMQAIEVAEHERELRA